MPWTPTRSSDVAMDSRADRLRRDDHHQKVSIRISLRFAVPRSRKLAAGILLSPLIAGYKCGLISDPAIRRVLSRASFQGDDPARVRALGERSSTCCPA